MTRWNTLLGCLALALAALAFAAPRGAGQDDPQKPAAEKANAAPKPPTVKVEKGPFKIAVSLKGGFEGGQAAPVAVSLEGWTPQGGGGPLIVRKVVEHGAAVRKGDPLVWLDTEKIEEAVRDLETQQRLSALAIELAEKELPVLERSVPAELAAAERAKKIADEDLEKFLKEDRDFTRMASEFSLKSARTYLEYEQEELKQLEKMYKADELTEETEEIILKRQRFYVDMAAFYLRMAERDHRDTLAIELPRRDQALHENATRLAILLAKARSTLPLELDQKRLNLEKLKHERQKSGERLAKLKRDLEAMTVKAPADGVVYYGRWSRGRWAGAEQVAEKLRPGGQLQPDEVILTVVTPEGLVVRAEVEEKNLHHLRPGMEAKVVPTGRPDLSLPAKVESVSAVPVAPGKFLARVTVEAPEGGPPLVPGMACSVKVAPYLKEEALTLPAASVFADELDEEKHYVFVPGADGKPVKRAVRVGKKTEQKVEILEGLKEGDEVLKERPDGAPALAAAPAKEEEP